MHKGASGCWVFRRAGCFGVLGVSRAVVLRRASCGVFRHAGCLGVGALGVRGVMSLVFRRAGVFQRPRRRVSASRRVFRMSRECSRPPGGEISYHGALPSYRPVNAPWYDKSPGSAWSMLRVATSLRARRGQRSVVRQVSGFGVVNAPGCDKSPGSALVDALGCGKVSGYLGWSALGGWSRFGAAPARGYVRKAARAAALPGRASSQ